VDLGDGSAVLVFDPHDDLPGGGHANKQGQGGGSGEPAAFGR
jgi:hypothetical protein